LSDAQRQAICNSRSGYYIAMLLDRADLVIPQELHQVLEPYLKQLDQSVPHEHVIGGKPLELPAGFSFGNPALSTAAESPLNTAPPPPSFPAVGGFTPLAPAAGEHSAGRIEAQPAQPAGSFR